MARFIREIMNPEVFSLKPDTRREDALEAILLYEITAAPVLDDERRPIGVTSLRDLVREGPEPRISKPALTISANESVENAARLMGESGRHHVVVVGGDGRAVGMVSSLDLLRALAGLPPSYPSTFPHYDAEHGVAWSNLTLFDSAHIETAPDDAGVLVLSAGGARRSESDLWVEASNALRPRLAELLEIPQTDEPALAQILQRKDLRFRCAVTRDAHLRQSVARSIRERIDGAPLPRDLGTTT